MPMWFGITDRGRGASSLLAIISDTVFVTVFMVFLLVELSAHFKSGPDYRFNLTACILIQTPLLVKTIYTRQGRRHSTNRRQAYAFQTASEICRKVRNALYLQEQQ